MSDENRYIFERQNLKEKPIGLILEKPSVLLKRNHIQDTSFKEEQLNEGTKYERGQGHFKVKDALYDA